MDTFSLRVFVLLMVLQWNVFMENVRNTSLVPALKLLNYCLIPDMKSCYGEQYPELMDAALLWNERVDRGIPAIASALGSGSIEGKHMAMDIALMFDHWDIISQMVDEILAEDPNDPHALFAKAMYGFENVLPGVSREEIPAVIDHMLEVAPKTASVVDRALADVKMTWEHEFLHPFTSLSIEDCGRGMNSTVLSELFPYFMCEHLPEVYNPRDLAILVFGAGGGNVLDVRIETARRLAERYPQATILATGGALDTDRAEGDLILEALPQFADRIVVDRKARDTIGNSLAIAEWLKENDIGNLLIVTSTWHLPRSSGALRGVLQREGMYPKTYLVGAGNNVQTPLGALNEENIAWLETAYGGLGRFRTIEIPMTNRDFARGAGLFTMCDFMELEGSDEDEQKDEPIITISDETNEKSSPAGDSKRMLARNSYVVDTILALSSALMKSFLI